MSWPVLLLEGGFVVVMVACLSLLWLVRDPTQAKVSQAQEGDA